MTAAILCPLLKSKYFDNNGAPLAGGTLSTFSAGTTNPIATFVDSTGTTQNTNPIVLNARGEADVFLLPNVGYKFQLKDAQGNLIWSEDNITSSQLITLYGGVDTGIANQYILNFTASFSSYQDGIAIYWVPANTNTGASTINVNGLGIVSVLNQLGQPLTGTGSEIVANTINEIVFKAGAFRVVSTTLIPVPFGAYKTSTQPISASSTTTVIFDVNQQNPQTNYSTTTGIFTAPAPGTYLFNASLILQNNATNAGVLTNAAIFKNTGTGGGLIYLNTPAFGTSIAGASAAFPATGSGTFFLLAGDTVQVKVTTGAGFGGGGNFGAISGSLFTGVKLT